MEKGGALAVHLDRPKFSRSSYTRIGEIRDRLPTFLLYAPCFGLCADSGPSRPHDGTGKFDPLRTFAPDFCTP
jgi:hypothetical protein